MVSTGTRARYATGRGNADKFTVTNAIRRRYPHVRCTDHNQVDALVLAAMGLDRLGHPSATVPTSHRAALAVVAWPYAMPDGQ